MNGGGESMPTRNIKQEAIKLVENLPEDATWDDLMYRPSGHLKRGLKIPKPRSLDPSLRSGIQVAQGYIPVMSF